MALSTQCSLDKLTSFQLAFQLPSPEALPLKPQPDPTSTFPIVKSLLAPPSDLRHKSESTRCKMNFYPAQDTSTFKVLSYPDIIHHNQESSDLLYEDSQISFHHWMTPSPLSEFESYETMPHCQQPSAMQQPYVDMYNIHDEYHEKSLFWQDDKYNTTYTFVDSTSAETMSPSISITSSSPCSEISSLSPTPSFNEFTNVFDFDYTTSLPNEFPSTSAPQWNATFLAPNPPMDKPSSPSPSCSSVDTNDAKSLSDASRESSPSRSEPDPNMQRRRFPCLILGCARRFTSKYTLKVHMEAHKPKPRTSFPCTLGCSERFSRQHDRLRHEVAKHGKICEFSCEDCGRFFSTKKTLGNHKCPLSQGGTRWVTS